MSSHAFQAFDVRSLAGIAFFAILAVGVWRVAQRIFFHPLSKVPGPKLAAASRWWEFYVDAFHGGGGQFVFERRRLHDQLGPIIRVAPNEVHIRDSRWSKVLYGGPGSVRHRPEWLSKIFGSEFGSFGSPDHHLHKLRRRAMMPFFSKRHVTNLQPSLDLAIEQLCKAILRQPSGTAIDIKVLMFAYATDANTTATLGKPYGMLHDDQRAYAWYEAHDRFKYGYALCKQLRWIPKVMIKYRAINNLLSLVSKETGDLLGLYWEMYDRAADAIAHYQQRLQEDDKPISHEDKMESLMQTILNSDLPAEQKSQLRLTHETFESFAAGSASAARVLSNAFYFILSDQTCLKRVNAEVQRLMPSREEIPPLTLLQSNDYLNAIIKETLRISALLPISMARVADAPLQYGEYLLPAGTIIGMSYSDILMDEEIFPNPTKFNPDRWLVSDAEHLKLMDENFVPFGRGTRVCIGIELAYSSLYRVLVTLFRRFEMELYDTVRERDVDTKFGWFLAEPSKHAQGIRVLFRPKEESTSDSHKDIPALT